MSETSCLVFYPDVGDMLNLAIYIASIEKRHPNIGICKLVPPLGWYSRTYELSTIDLPDISPIKQYVDGRGGSYHVTSLEVKNRTLADFYDYAMCRAANPAPIAERVRQFWRTLGKGEPSLYGADMEGSMFDPEIATSECGLTAWNLNVGLCDLLRMLPYQVPGVNTTMIYVGMWRSMFAFHVEDLDLYSINYVHTGAAKSWYSIAPANRQRFEALSESQNAADKRVCGEYLRHKTKLFSPTLMKDCGLEFDTVVQQPGEFVVTFPGAYHAGFNHGFNVAEATNFATPRWLELGRKAKRCVCRPHSVFINMDELETIYRRKVIAETANSVGYDDPRSSVPSCGESCIQREHYTKGEKSTAGCSSYPDIVDLTQDDIDCDCDTDDRSGYWRIPAAPIQQQQHVEESPVPPRMRCGCGCLGLVSEESLADLYLRNLASSARARSAARRAGQSSSMGANADGVDGDVNGDGSNSDVDCWVEDSPRSYKRAVTSPTAPDLPVDRCIKCHFYVHLACVAKYPEAYTVCHLCRRIDSYNTPPASSSSLVGHHSLVGKRKVQPMQQLQESDEACKLSISLKRRRVSAGDVAATAVDHHNKARKKLKLETVSCPSDVQGSLSHVDSAHSDQRIGTPSQVSHHHHKHNHRHHHRHHHSSSSADGSHHKRGHRHSDLIHESSAPHKHSATGSHIPQKNNCKDQRIVENRPPRAIAHPGRPSTSRVRTLL